jgi:ATP-dependent helicase/nuclease subunit A
MTFVAPLHLLKASAGSGKTFALTLHYIVLVLQHRHTFREILALTFTNKATAEMKTRILDVLEGLAQGNQDPSIQAYRLQIRQLQPHWSEADIQQRADECYREILHQYHYFSVSTIDGFSQKVIRAFLFELGIDQLVHLELRTDKVKRDLIRRLYIHLEENPNLLEWIVQRMQMKLDEGNAWNIEKDLSSLAGLIFSEDFLAIDDRLRQLDADELFKTVHDYNSTLIEQFEKDVHALLNQYQQVLSASGIQRDEMKGKSRNKLWSLSGITLKNKKVVEISKLLIELIDVQEHYLSQDQKRTHDALFAQLNPLFIQLNELINDVSPTYELAKAVQKNLHYLRLVKEMSVLLADWRQDNQAQLLSDAQLLLQKIGQTEQGDPTFIWEKMGNRYRYFLYDEFQDTSKQQWNNFKPLLFNALSAGAGEKREHLIVGDVKQSIYRWRNGDFRLLLQGIEEDILRHFHVEESSPLLSQGELLENYRSGAEIIAFNNFLYTQLPTLLSEQLNHLALQELGEEAYAKLWVHQRLDTTLQRAYSDAVQHLPAHKQDTYKGQIRVEHLVDPALRSNSVNKEGILEKTFAQIKEWIENKQYEPGQIGLLVRTNAEAMLLVDYFQKAQRDTGFYFPFVSGEFMKLWSNSAVRLLIQTFKFLLQSNPKHSLYLSEMGYYYTQLRQISLDEDQWMRLAKGDINRVSDIFPEQMIQQWVQYPTLPLLELYEQLLQGYQLYDQAEHLPYILALGDILFHQVQNGKTDLASFLAFWEEEQKDLALPSGENGGAVEILTIHKSKGLAFDVAMVPFAHWSLSGLPTSQVWVPTEHTAYAAFGTLPLQWSSLKNSLLREYFFIENLYQYMDALNTLYVATTRARHELVLYIGHGKSKEGLKTIGDALLTLLPQYEKGTLTHDPLQLEILNPHQTPKSVQNLPSNAFQIATLHRQGSLNQLLSRHRIPQNNTRISGPESAAFGTTLHQLIEVANNAEQLKRFIEEYDQMGLLTKSQLPLAEKWIIAAQNHPELGDLWAQNHSTLIEQAIIDTQGATWRPDKIIRTETTTWLIDYKLSGLIAPDRHQQQIRNYAYLLHDMGFPDVRGHLYYFIQDEWVEVIMPTSHK